STTISPSDKKNIERATTLIFERAGILVPDHKGQTVFRQLQSLASKHRLTSTEALLDTLQANPNHEAWPAFISNFTINHTAFFRENHHFLHLAKQIKNKRSL